jgi:hypothetical protein
LTTSARCNDKSDRDLIHQRLRTPPTINEDKNKVTICVHDLTLNKHCLIFNDNNYEKIFVSVEFLNYPIKELETPCSLPKDKPYTKYAFNFIKGYIGICLFTGILFVLKDCWIHDPEQKHQLVELVGPHSSGEYVAICFISFWTQKKNMVSFAPGLGLWW